MRAPLVAVLIVLLASLPLPTAQAASWSVEATVTVTSTTTADYTWSIGLTTPTRLKLPMPDNATFVEARDVDGRRLDASVTGDEVTVTSGRRPFVLSFSLEGQRDGPFTIFPAQVASGEDSPVTVRIALPAGWSLAGYRDGDDRHPDLTGAFHGSGPAYVQYLALDASHSDEGPVPGVAGTSVRREASADIDTSGVRWSLTTTYDTDVYSPEWKLHLPPGATVTGTSSPVGPFATRVEGETLHVTAPYPVGFHLGARPFTVDMMLPPPVPQGGTFREANLSVPAYPDDEVRIVAQLAEGLRYTGARVGGGNETAPLLYEGVGPLSIGVAFLPPPAPGHVQLEEGLFVVDVPRALEAAARATARNASALLPQVADFAFDASDARPFFVAYTDADVFGWEEGFYSNGLNTIAIRTSTLADASDGRPHLQPVGVLVHEATHGMLDRRLPDVPHDLSFLHEGLARLAETRLESVFPEREIVSCTGVSCTRHSARPSAEDLQSFHQQSTAEQGFFDVAWHAPDVPDSRRGFHYDYSGLILHAFDLRAPPGALANALLHIERTAFADEPASDAQRVLDIFLANTPGTTAPAFLYPGREAASLPADQFRFCLEPLVAPGYPWQDARAPPGGCPSTGYGSRDAPLPAVPPARETGEPRAPTTPVVTRPPPLSPPTSFPPEPTSSPEPDPDPQPGAIGQPVAPTDGVASPGSTAPTFVPAPPAALLLVALALVALVARRR